MEKGFEKFLQENERIIEEDKGTTNAPIFYDSLRHGFDFFFKTFRSKNASYENYAFSMLHPEYSNEQLRKSQNEYITLDFTDDDNFLLSIVSFQRFCELFIKKVLREVDERLILKSNTGDILPLLNANVKSKKNHPRIEAGEAISRIQNLFKQNEDGSFAGDVLPGFEKAKNIYGFLGEEIHIETISQLTKWRNSLLHGGTIFPNLLAIDYFFCNNIVPLVIMIVKSDANLENSNIYYYLKTLTGIDLLEKMASIKINIASLNKFPRDEETSEELLRLGHLKELGRANIKMNLFMRRGHSTYEYNYHDVFGRGRRFAEAEKRHEHFKAIKSCPCCGKESLVLYEHLIDDFFDHGRKKSIQWVTCYTCSYHIRYNVGDPFYRDLSKEPVFSLLV
jgi:hypothetical protein